MYQNDEYALTGSELYIKAIVLNLVIVCYAAAVNASLAYVFEIKSNKVVKLKCGVCEVGDNKAVVAVLILEYTYESVLGCVPSVTKLKCFGSTVTKTPTETPWAASSAFAISCGTPSPTRRSSPWAT